MSIHTGQRIRTRVASSFVLLAIAGLACARKHDPPNASRTRETLGCIRLDAPLPVDSSAVTENVRAGRRYRCVLHAVDAPIVAQLIADSASNTVDSIALRRDDGNIIQMLTAGAEESPYRGAEVFRAVDFDDDGRLELALLSSWGATGNQQWNVWRQDARAGRFTLDSTLSELWSPKPVAGHPCVASHSVGGAAGMIYDSVLVCRVADRWVDSVMASARPGPSDDMFILTVRERRGDALVVVRIDTVRDTLR